MGMGHPLDDFPFLEIHDPSQPLRVHLSRYFQPTASRDDSKAGVGFASSRVPAHSPAGFGRPTPGSQPAPLVGACAAGRARFNVDPLEASAEPGSERGTALVSPDGFSIAFVDVTCSDAGTNGVLSTGGLFRVFKASAATFQFDCCRSTVVDGGAPLDDWSYMMEFTRE